MHLIQSNEYETIVRAVGPVLTRRRNGNDEPIRSRTFTLTLILRTYTLLQEKQNYQDLAVGRGCH